MLEQFLNEQLKSITESPGLKKDNIDYVIGGVKYLVNYIENNYAVCCKEFNTKSPKDLFENIFEEIDNLDFCYRNKKYLYFTNEDVKELNCVIFGWAQFKSQFPDVSNIEVKQFLHLTAKGREIINGYRRATGRPLLN